MPHTEPILADRLGLTVHCSPLRHKLRRLAAHHRGPLEDWLLEVANQRGVTVVERFGGRAVDFPRVPVKALSDEELVVGICLLDNRDRPQWLRAAAQLVSRGRLDLHLLKRFARMERVEVILAGLAGQALKVEPQHPHWKELLELGKAHRPLRDTLLHWTRIAEPVPKHRRAGVKEWRLPR